MNRGDMNIFGNVTYDNYLYGNETEEERLARERKGFECCGMYVVGTTKHEFEKFLDDMNWMIF